MIVAASLGGTSFWVGTGILVATFGIFTLGLQLNVGFTGLLNFGQVGFMAIGAYAMAILVNDAHLVIWVAMPAAVSIAMAAGALLGLTTLRLRGDYFAIASVAFAEIVRYVAQNARGFTGGNLGLFGYDADWVSTSNSISDTLSLRGDLYEVPLLIAAWILFLLLLVALRVLQSTPWGRVLRAIREDEDAVRALGKNPMTFKLQSLAVGSALGATSGLVLALHQAEISPPLFAASVTFLGYTMMMLGGLGSYAGVLIGAVLLEVFTEAMRSLPVSDADAGALRFILVGLLLIAVVALRPQGILGNRREMVLGD